MTIGIYRDVPMADYHAWDAASNSRLSWMMRSPAHCRAYIDAPAEDTDAMRLGRAAHTVILEPSHFSDRYVRATQCIATTKTTQRTRCGKTGTHAVSTGTVCAQHAALFDVASRPHREVLRDDDWTACWGMAEAVQGIERANALLSRLEDVELSVRWEDRETGVGCKARWDGYTDINGGCILDLKTTRDASPRKFARSIFEYGYHRQGAFYLESAAAHGIEARHYVIIAVETQPPYAACLYRLTEGALAGGSDQIRVLLRRYAECLAADSWPGYSAEVQDIGLPEWAWNQLEEQVR